MSTVQTAEGLAARLERTIAQARPQAAKAGRSIVVSASEELSTAATPLEAFATGATGAERNFWARPGEDLWIVGLGFAARLAFRGPNAVAGARAGAADLFSGAVVSGDASVNPMLLGGFRFDAGADPDPAWAGFPDGLLVLPRLMQTWRYGRRYATANALVSPGDSQDVALREVDRLLRQAVAGRPYAVRQPAAHYVSGTDESTWTLRVNEALDAIRQGRMQKVVLARRQTLQADSPFSIEAALHQLIHANQRSAVFAVDTGDACFLGASPESLVRVRQGVLDLTCLAGSAPRGATEEADRAQVEKLLASEKDRREHAAVVAMIAENLAAVTADLRWESEPRVVSLRTVHHFATSFHGTVEEAASLLDLVERLHPTPAVGGVPTDRAVEAIRRVEGDRGWYAGSVGWLDAHGEGEFYVGIRSALVRGDRATLYAGAGIVEGSDPHDEYEETGWKFQPLLKALTHE